MDPLYASELIMLVVIMLLVIDIHNYCGAREALDARVAERCDRLKAWVGRCMKRE